MPFKARGSGNYASTCTLCYYYLRLGHRRTVLDTDVSGESLDEDSDEQVEQNVVAECHKKDEIQSGPRRRLRHAVVQHLLPVFLRQDLTIVVASHLSTPDSMLTSDSASISQ